MHTDSDLKSALQKFIRRGRHDDAVAIANALCDRIFPSGNVRLLSWFWKRLFIIASEDIGVAQRMTIRYLQSVHALAKRHFDNNETDHARKCCLEAVLTLSRSPKSRLTDNAYIWFSRRKSLFPGGPEIAVNADKLYSSIQCIDELALLELIVSMYHFRKHPKLQVKERDVFQALGENLQSTFATNLKAYGSHTNRTIVSYF